MTGGEDQSGRSHRLDGRLRTGAGHRHRLFAEHVLAGGRSRFDLAGMELVRGDQQHSLDIRIGKRRLEIGGHRYAVGLGKAARDFAVRLDSADDGNVFGRGLQHCRDLLSPPAEPDKCNADRATHERLSTRLLKGWIETFSQMPAR